MDENDKKSKKGGRPEKEVKRGKRITVRLTNSEYFVIHHKATKAHLPLSNYIRECAIQATVKARFSEEDQHFYRQLTGISNNINQLAKLAHQQGLFSAMMHFEKELKQIEELLSGFKK